jgi:hypothetical protein
MPQILMQTPFASIVEPSGVTNREVSDWSALAAFGPSRYSGETLKMDAPSPGGANEGKRFCRYSSTLTRSRSRA